MTMMIGQELLSVFMSVKSLFTEALHRFSIWRFLHNTVSQRKCEKSTSMTVVYVCVCVCVYAAVNFVSDCSLFVVRRWRNSTWKTIKWKKLRAKELIDFITKQSLQILKFEARGVVGTFFIFRHLFKGERWMTQVPGFAGWACRRHRAAYCLPVCSDCSKCSRIAPWIGGVRS